MSSTAWLAIVGGAGLLVYVVFAVVHIKAAAAPNPPDAPVNIVRFELIGSGLAAYDLLAALGVTGRRAAKRCLALDSGIIAGYVIAFVGFGSSAMVAATNHAAGGVRAGAIAAATLGLAFGVVAGVCDLVENSALRAVLEQWSDAGAEKDPAKLAAHRRDCAKAMDTKASHAAKAARLKFTLLAIGAPLVIAAWTMVYAAR